MENSLNSLLGAVIWQYVLIVLAVAYFAKNPLKKLLGKLFKIEFDMKYVVLILSTLVAIPFFIWSDFGWVSILLSYALATTFHEILLKYVLNWFERQFGVKDTKL